MGTSSRTRLGQDRGIGKALVSGGQRRGAASHADILSSPKSQRPHPLPPSTPIFDLGSSVATTPGAPGVPDDTQEDTASEIIVWTEDMKITDLDSSASSTPPQTPQDLVDRPSIAMSHQLDAPDAPDPPAEDARTSFESPMSACSGQSDLSSLPPSTVSSKATTPVDVDSSKELPAQLIRTSQPISQTSSQTPSQPATTSRRSYDVRPRVSIPTDLPASEYAVQCIAAAESSRLNPYALHEEEYLILREHISHAQVTTYLNIRNGILRLWVRNPQIAVTREEAIGCAKDTRWFDVASVCFDWLVRRGFINFGCVQIRSSRKDRGKDSPPTTKRRKVVVIGAGMSGLGCARQLEALFTQYAKKFRDLGEEYPEVLVLEGRNRIGGRVYSRAFKAQPAYPPPIFQGKRCTAEMGGMIITGFEGGNPLNILVRGQLSLAYHALRPETTIYDSSGKPVDAVRDQLIEKLFNDCLERASEYKFKPPQTKLIEGNRDLMDEGRDSSAEVHKPISVVEEMAAAQPHAFPVPERNAAPQVDLAPVSSDSVTGKVHVEAGTPWMLKASQRARVMGWALKSDVPDERDLSLDPAAKLSEATLGSVMDEAFSQYRDIVDLNAQDYRLLNWHVANLEYSNAINYKHMSLRGWDIDVGNEWQGKHTMVIGGYQTVPRGLTLCPTPLNIRQGSAVRKITYNHEGAGPRSATVECEDGYAVEADYVVNTIPLGVLKHGNVEFEPRLPSWKCEAVNRLGFGVLNKVILVYGWAFWDTDRDIFGVLRNPINRGSLVQKDYASRRGRFFQWFNVSNTTGLPCLVALMAGDAGFDTEKTCNDDLVAEATEVLRSVYGPHIPEPVETVVTRWASDKFARGSYSSAGPNMQADDYDIMARPIGNLFFAGEHTTGMYPATVHGAYLSGLRAASEVLEAILGPIEIPVPLIIPRETATSLKRKALEENKDPTQARLEAYELEVWEHICGRIGHRPIKPAKPAMNAYLFYSRANLEVARRKCEEGRRSGKSKRKTSANEVRTVTARMWKDTTAEERRPFEQLAEEKKSAYAAAVKEYEAKAAVWDAQALQLKAEYEKEHPSVPGPEELLAAESRGERDRRSKNVASYAESEGSDVDMLS